MAVFSEIAYNMGFKLSQRSRPAGTSEFLPGMNETRAQAAPGIADSPVNEARAVAPDRCIPRIAVELFDEINPAFDRICHASVKRTLKAL